MSQREIGICPQTETKCIFKESPKLCPEFDTLYCRNFALISGSGNQPLFQEVASILDAAIPEVTGMFPDEESKVEIPESIRGMDVFIFQTGQPHPNDRIVESALMLDAARRGSARSSTVVMPYFPYSRGDRKDKPRVPISAAMVAEILEERGASRILSIDLHAEQEEGSVKIPWDNLYSSYVLVPELKKYVDDNVVVASPDAGGVRRANFYAEILGSHDIAVAPKIRDPKKGNLAKSLGVIGDVEGRDVLLADDIVDSARTLKSAAENLKAAGAKSIIVAAAHGLFSGEALENITNSPIDLVFTTNSIEQRPEVLENPKIKVVSIAPLIASAICRIQSDRSISDLFLDTNGKTH